MSQILKTKPDEREKYECAPGYNSRLNEIGIDRGLMVTNNNSRKRSVNNIIDVLMRCF